MREEEECSTKAENYSNHNSLIIWELSTRPSTWTTRRGTTVSSVAAACAKERIGAVVKTKDRNKHDSINSCYLSEQVRCHPKIITQAKNLEMKRSTNPQKSISFLQNFETYGGFRRPWRQFNAICKDLRVTWYDFVAKRYVGAKQSCAATMELSVRVRA